MEKQQRQLLVKHLRAAGLDPGSVENSAGPGTPDIQFIGGWIECKWIADWPTNIDTPVRIPHYTPQQRVWSLRRWKAGGWCWLVLQVAKTNEWLIFNGDTAAYLVGKVSRINLCNAARHHSHDAKSIVRHIKGMCECSIHPYCS